MHVCPMRPAFFDPGTWDAGASRWVGSTISAQGLSTTSPGETTRSEVPDFPALLTFCIEKVTRCPLVEQIVIRNWRLAGGIAPHIRRLPAFVPHNAALKLYCLTDSLHAYIPDVYLYTGKRSS